MHDIRFIRNDPDAFDAALARRGSPPVAAELAAIDERHRAIQTELQQLQARRNEASREIGQRKKSGTDAAALITEVGAIKARAAELEGEAAVVVAALDDRLAALPNLPDADVPDGADETANRVERVVGTPPRFDFPARDHVALGESLGRMDFELAARMAGSRFVVLTGVLARLERALAAFMLDIHTREFGYLETIPPFLVRDAAMFGTGQLPKFAEDLFRTTDDRWLIPTAEVPLTNFAMDRIFAGPELPLRLTAYTPCFRAEAGAAGRDTRGMIRQHQFSKVELVSITMPEASADEHERMTACAETVLQRLELPYRVVTLCTGDLGFAARKTYDIEVWLPGQSCYREISSCSNCGDFQARRMAARHRPDGQRRTEFVHTLNGSALAVGRTMIALMENGQRDDGTVVLPEALHPYMGGLSVIEQAGADADG